jgi:hypothetical protein
MKCSREQIVSGLKAAYYQASDSPLGKLSGDCFAFFLLELWVELGVDNPVLLILLLISPDVRMSAFPAKLLFFLLLPLCIEVSKGTCFFAEKYSEVFRSLSRDLCFYFLCPWLLFGREIYLTHNKLHFFVHQSL